MRIFLGEREVSDANGNAHLRCKYCSSPAFAEVKTEGRLSDVEEIGLCFEHYNIFKMVTYMQN